MPICDADREAHVVSITGAGTWVRSRNSDQSVVLGSSSMMDRSRSDMRLLKGFSAIAGGTDRATTGILMGGGKILAVLGDEEV